jgi:hypothetical protein
MIPLAQEEDKQHWSTGGRCWDGHDRMPSLIKRSAIMAGMAFQSEARPSSRHTLTGAVVEVTLEA